MKKIRIEEVRRWLKGYRLHIKEIQSRAEHIKWLKTEVYAPLTEGNSKASFAAKKVDLIMEGILKDASMHLSILKYEAECIEKEINNLDQFERCVLYNRYILGVPWVDLPERVGYEIAQCQRIERKALTSLAGSPIVQYFLNKDPSTPLDKSVYNLAFGEGTTII